MGQVNRATAESSQARAIAEGLAPLQKHMRVLMNRIIQRDMGFIELEFAWQDTRQRDPREGSGGNSSEGGNNKKPNDPKDDKESEWSFGTYKSKERWGNQMKERKWTEQEITDRIKTGKADPAPNYINKGNTATRYTDSQSGKFVVRDDVTKEILQIGGEKYEPLTMPKQ